MHDPKEPIKFLHLFGGGIRNAIGLFRWVSEREDAKEQLFFFPYEERNIRNYSPEIQAFDNLICFMCRGGILKKLYYQYQLYSRAKHIIVHGIYFGIKPLLLLLSQKKFRKKLSWVEWNGDLYLWKKPQTSLKNRVYNWVNYKIRKVFSVVGIIFPTDEEFFKTEFNPQAVCMYTPMGGSDRPILIMDKLLKEGIPSLNRVVVQIGHCSYQFENHIKLMKYVEHFRGKDIQFIIPLSYGMQGLNGMYGGYDYRRKVINVAHELLGKKATPFLKNIPFENYIQYLSRVDIYVSDVGRTFGIANIMYLLYMGKKVFLPAGNPFYDFFIEHGFEIFDTNKIPEMTYEEFIRPVSKVDRKWILERHTEAINKEYWNKFFQKIEEIQS